ncbi:MAG TPA: hypothetical protein VJY35_09045 [Candidatus Eisenbacteria bacterium]|nr:hypothetical protein [Candidatus Eisenbacteria bacterium]
MRSVLVMAALLLAPAAATAAPAAYATRVSDANLMGVTITNYGFIGNLFVTRSPSMEYPLGTGFEHLVYGGLWIGARRTDLPAPFTGVTTACLDHNPGLPSAPITEFTPGAGITLRSNRPTSPLYDPAAISELDMISDYDDLTPRSTTDNPEAHRPLGLRVRQENYAWSLGPLDHVLFFRFVITSAGPTLTDLHIGLLTEFGSGQKNDYTVWPPSTFGGPDIWFSRAWFQFDDALSLLREHYCRALPIPDGCALAYVPYWAGLKLLTPSGPGLQRTLGGWRWNRSATERDQDVERYALMSAGTIVDLAQPMFLPTTGDPMELFAVGPYPSLAPGDSIVVGFALIGGSEVDDIQENARVAQRAWESRFTDLPTPVQLARASMEARSDRVAIAWQTEPGLATLVERRADGPWAEIARPRADGSGRIEFEDRDVISGTRYGYRISAEESGAPVVLDEVWVDVPAAAELAIAGWMVDASRTARPRVALSLASGSPATLELFDPGGRRLHVQRIEGASAGPQVVTLDLPRAPGSGVYFLRLAQEGAVAHRRVVALR